MLLEPFLRQCGDRPDSLALAESGRTLTYGELLQSALNVAAALRRRGAGVGDRVAILLDHGIDGVVGIFGVLLAGACYVPLDVRNPAARLSYIVADARVEAVLGIGEEPDWLDSSLWLDLRRIAPSGSAAGGLQMPGGEAPAAILYTSGSTGNPKGVVLNHHGVAAFTRWARALAELRPADRIAGSAPFYFDLSTFDLYAVLGGGASLHIVPAGLTLAPATLSAWLKGQAISGWYTVPSLLSFLAYKGNLGQTPLTALRFLIFAGEVFPSPALIALADMLPGTRLYNFYGPTETNVCCYWEVDRRLLRPDASIPIGRPAAGDELRIEEGELLVRGPTLASGYWSDGSIRPLGEREGWYATGDGVSVDDCGEFRFHGRLDRMLKCSGYRVEPAEIEAAVSSVPGVRECAVVGIDDPAAGRRPALALSLQEPATLAAVRAMLRERLPAYMQPARWLTLEALPRLSNGKLDYRRIEFLTMNRPEK